MLELDKNALEPEPQAIVQPEAQQEEQQPTQEEQQEKAPVENHWEQARNVMKAQKAELDALKAHIQEMQQKLTAPPKQEEPDEFAGIAPDDVLTFEQAKKLAEKLATKRAEETAKKIVQEYQQQASHSSQEQKMREVYEDYDYVVEKYAIPMIQNNPALAQALKASPNPFKLAYQMAKSSDDYEASMTKQQTSPKAEKILKNSNRPTSVQSVSPSLKQQAQDFSKMSQQDIWQQAQKYARQAP